MTAILQRHRQTKGQKDRRLAVAIPRFVQHRAVKINIMEMTLLLVVVVVVVER